MEKLGLLMTQTWFSWNLMSWKKLTKYGNSTLPCLRPAFCHKDKQNYYSDYLLDQVTSPWALFYVSNWQNLALGLSMVHLKSDVRKITYCIWEQHLAMYKTSILPPEHMKILQWSFFKWLLEKETDIALIVVTLWSSMPLLEPPLFFKLAKLGPLIVQTWYTRNLMSGK